MTLDERVARFTDTPYDTAEVKRRFFARFTRWLQRGAPRAQFVNWPGTMYKPLALHLFRHIAEYSEHGFYGSWFSTPQQRAAWVEYVRRQGPRSEDYVRERPDLWADVENAILAWLDESGVGDRLIDEARSDTERQERAQLRALLERYPDEVTA